MLDRCVTQVVARTRRSEGVRLTGSGTDPTTEDAETLWTPTAEWIAGTQLTRYVDWLAAERGLTFQTYQDLWQWSIDELDAFWRSVLDFYEVLYDGDPSVVLASREMPGADWFPNVSLNFAENALRGPDEDEVIVALSQTRPDSRMTRGELRDAVARAAEGLRRLGVGPGDRVAGFLPNIPETVIALLATASIGAVWAVCSPELGWRSVVDRLQQIQPKVLLAVDGYRYGDKDVDRLDELATVQAALPTLEATVFVPYLRAEPPAVGISWSEFLSHEAKPAYTRVPFGAPLWILFSSGTTGLPKAIVHAQGGTTLEQYKSASLQIDLGPGDRYFVYCTTTWMMWNLQVSCLLVGSTAILFDGNPNFPDREELWRILGRTRVTHFACGAAFFTASRQQHLVPKDRFDLSNLQGMLSTGSPLPPDTFRWIYQAVSSDVFLQSGSGGTDVCSGFVGGSPWLPVRAGKIACRLLGIDVAAFDEKGYEIIGSLGELVIKQPMPSMPIYFWNDPDGERYRNAYFAQFPGTWCHGDWDQFDESGSCIITGRSDGTLNRGGVRLGTAEFYAALEDIEGIADSLVIHLEDPDGEGLGKLVLFVQLAPGAELDEAMRGQVSKALREALSPRHVPDLAYAVPAIPYNLTGKKLEVPVKKILKGARLADVVSEGAIRDPRSLDAFVELGATIRAQ